MKSLKTIATEFAKLDKEQAKLDARKAKLKEDAGAALKKSGQSSATFNEGIIGFVAATSYVYSKVITKKEEELADLKKKERETGKAEKVQGVATVRFTPKK